MIVSVGHMSPIKQKKEALDARRGPLISDLCTEALSYLSKWADVIQRNVLTALHFYRGQAASGITDRSSDWRTGWKKQRRRTQQRHWCRGSRPVTMLMSLLLEEHSQVRWLAVSSVYQSASLARRLAALKCHISTVMNWESEHYSQTSPLLRPH